jgi:hypothetical protein
MTAAEAREDGVGHRVEDLLDRTRADPALGPEERGTTVAFAVDEDTARIHTEEAALIRRLLAHHDVRVDTLGVFDGDRRRRLSLEEALTEIRPDELVVRLRGTIPVRYLGVSCVPRNHDRHAAVVSSGVFD